MNTKYTYLIVSLFLCLSLHSFGQETQTKESNAAVFYFIRHAEKDRSNPNERNPHLTEQGHYRAKQWAHFFKDIPLAAVYSSPYHRTIETATPTAAQKNLEVLSYDPRNLDPKPFLEQFPKGQILIVGHSNTTPAFVNAFLEKARYDDLDDSDNGSVFVLYISEDFKLVNQYHID